LDTTATPIMGVFEAAEAAAAALAEKAAADAERERAAAAGELDPQAEEAAAAETKPETPPAAPAKKGAPPEPEPEPEAAEPRDMTQDVQDACRALPMELHSLILTAAYNYECQELLAKTVAAAKSRLRTACDRDSCAPPVIQSLPQKRDTQAPHLAASSLCVTDRRIVPTSEGMGMLLGASAGQRKLSSCARWWTSWRRWREWRRRRTRSICDSWRRL